MKWDEISSADDKAYTRIPVCPFPSVNWFLLAGKTPLLDLHEYYVKQSYRNRYDILGVNGRTSLTIPVEGQKGQKIEIRDIRPASQTWQRQHRAAIRSAYGRAAFFEYYYPDLEQIFSREYSFLIDFNLRSLEWCIAHKIEIEPLLTKSHLAYEPSGISEKLEPRFVFPPLPSYPQVFSDRFEFESGLSVIDVLMNKGPATAQYIAEQLIQ